MPALIAGISGQAPCDGKRVSHVPLPFPLDFSASPTHKVRVGIDDRGECRHCALSHHDIGQKSYTVAAFFLDLAYKPTSWGRTADRRL